MFLHSPTVSLILVGTATAMSVYSHVGQRNEMPPATSLAFNFTNAVDPYNFSAVDLSGDGQIIYVANITVDRVSYEV